MEQRKGLGRGLASLIPKERIEQARGESSRAFREVAIDQVKSCMTQPRRNFDAESIKELAHSIHEKGILHPLLVRTVPGGYELISGERRLRAARMLSLEKVPILVRDVAPREQLELALIENLQRADLDPIEEARGYADLMERFEMTQEAVATRVGRERSTVANALRLLKLPEKIQEALRSGEISAGHAKVLLGETPDRQLTLFERIVKEGWSVRELETTIAHPTSPSSKAKKKTLSQKLSPVLGRIAEALRTSLGTQVRILPGRKGRGKIVIEYYSAEQLNDLCHKLRLNE